MEQKTDVHFVGNSRNNKMNAIGSIACGSSIALLIILIAEVNFKEEFEISVLHGSPPIYMQWPEAEDGNA